MSKLYRFGVSLEKALIDSFDNHIKTLQYNNRSEAIRDLIRNELIQKKWKEGGKVAGAIVMTYDHHKRDLASKIIDIQHHFHELIISTQHVHLDHDNCMEIIAVKGHSEEMEKLCSSLKALVGVNHVDLSISGTGD